MNPSIPSATPGQLAWQEKAFGLFCHFGLNTFHNREWSAGQLDPATFDPQRFDPAQWVANAQAAGMRYLILTAKHHDGFCLWPTATTAYSVASSPFRRDVVAEVARACEAAGMAFGLYLSPWDRNAACYDDKAAYDRFYLAQMTELCTRYGPLFEIWLDGAGSEGRSYDWDAIMGVIEDHQPGAMIFNMGRPTIRWIGNEDGLASDPNPYVVSALKGSAFTSATEQTQSEGAYLPPECDVAIRRHWFWQDDDLETLKSREHLLGICYRSLGRGANLLLNLGPNRDGLLDEHDCHRLGEVAAELRRRFAQPVAGVLTARGGGCEVDFGRAVAFDHLVLREDYRQGQRVQGYRVLDGETGRELGAGVTIGHQKWDVLPRTTARRLKVEFGSGSLTGATLSSVQAHLTRHETLPELGAHLDYSAWANKADGRDAHPPRWRPAA